MMAKKTNKYYIENENTLKENAKNRYRNLSEEEQEARKEYGRNRYRNMTEDKKKQAKRVTKKTIIQQKIKCIFCII